MSLLIPTVFSSWLWLYIGRFRGFWQETPILKVEHFKGQSSVQELSCIDLTPTLTEAALKILRKQISQSATKATEAVYADLLQQEETERKAREVRAMSRLTDHTSFQVHTCCTAILGTGAAQNWPIRLHFLKVQSFQCMTNGLSCSYIDSCLHKLCASRKKC